MSLSKKIWFLLSALTSGAALWMLNHSEEGETTSSLRLKMEQLQTQNSELSARVETLSQERQRLDNQISSLQEKAAGLPKEVPPPSRSDARTSGQKTPPTNGADAITSTHENETPFAAAVLALASRAAELNRYFMGTPDKEIPELQYLDEGDWLHLAKDARLDSPEGVRKALADVRQQAKVRFAPMLTSALASYFKANNAQPPISMDQLKPYFSVPVDDATLARYQISTDATGKQKLGSSTIISETAPVDPQFDSHFEIGLSGWSAATVRDSYSESFR